MEILLEIEQRLAKYPSLKYEIKGNSITVFPESENGFEVAFYAGDEDSYEPYSVYFNGWHGQFSDKDEALNCFVFGLTSECRLKETIRGDRVYKWTIEYLIDGDWQTDSTTALLFSPFWKKRKDRYL
jgi:hypothetical protein